MEQVSGDQLPRQRVEVAEACIRILRRENRRLLAAVKRLPQRERDEALACARDQCRRKLAYLDRAEAAEARLGALRSDLEEERTRRVAAEARIAVLEKVLRATRAAMDALRASDNGCPPP